MNAINSWVEVTWNMFFKIPLHVQNIRSNLNRIHNPPPIFLTEHFGQTLLSRLPLSNNCKIITLRHFGIQVDIFPRVLLKGFLVFLGKEKEDSARIGTRELCFPGFQFPIEQLNRVHLLEHTPFTRHFVFFQLLGQQVFQVVIRTSFQQFRKGNQIRFYLRNHGTY